MSDNESEFRVQSDLPNEHLEALGRVVDAWADLEFEIDHFIWDLLQTPQALAACVTSQLISIYPKMQALISLVDIYVFDARLTKDLNAFSGEIAQYAERRNRIIHDRRFLRAETGKVERMQITAKRKLDFSPKSETSSELTNFATTIRNKRFQFLKIRKKIDDHILSSTDKRRPPLPYIVRARGPNKGPTNSDR